MEHSSTEASVWTERFRIRSYDVDGTQTATLPRLCAYFLEAAWNHAETLGFGFTHLRKEGKFWVLSRFRLEMQEYPSWGDEVTLRTWPRGFEGAFALRDFELLNTRGARLGAGTSAWLILDLISKRPQRPHKLLPNLPPAKPALSRDPEKLADNHVWDNEAEITARHSDIDVNQHVTASRYIAWALDSYPIGFHAQHSVRVVDVNYLNETIEGERVGIRTRHVEAGIYTHSLAKTTGADVCRIRFEFVNRNE